MRVRVRSCPEMRVSHAECVRVGSSAYVVESHEQLDFALFINYLFVQATSHITSRTNVEKSDLASSMRQKSSLDFNAETESEANQRAVVDRLSLVPGEREKRRSACTLFADAFMCIVLV